MAEHWYVVHTKPRREAYAFEHLQTQGFKVWLPRIARRVRRRGSWASREEPLFARYLFLQVDPHQQDISPIRSTRGVSDLVRNAGVPLVVPEAVMAALQGSVDPSTGLHCLSEVPKPSFEAGAKVQVLEGPFAGLEGIFQKPSGEERALVLLSVLNQPTSVKLSTSVLAPIGEVADRKGFPGTQ